MTSQRPATITPLPLPNQAPHLMDQVRAQIRVRNYSLRTEQAYCDWIKRYILFHRKAHPSTLGKPDIEAFLAHLAVERHVSASTQNQAKAALLFLYGKSAKARARRIASPCSPPRWSSRSPTTWARRSGCAMG